MKVAPGSSIIFIRFLYLSCVFCSRSRLLSDWLGQANEAMQNGLNPTRAATLFLFFGGGAACCLCPASWNVVTSSANESSAQWRQWLCVVSINAHTHTHTNTQTEACAFVCWHYWQILFLAFRIGGGFLFLATACSKKQKLWQLLHCKKSVLINQ